MYYKEEIEKLKKLIAKKESELTEAKDLLMQNNESYKMKLSYWKLLSKREGKELKHFPRCLCLLKIQGYA